MADLKMCSISPDVMQSLKTFRFRKEKNNAAIILKIDKTALEIVLDEELEDCNMAEVRESLPEHQPRYVVYSFAYEKADGRISYPLCFIFVSPEGAQAEQQMMYAGSKTAVTNALGMSKVFTVRSVDELTDEWLVSSLEKFQ